MVKYLIPAPTPDQKMNKIRLLLDCPVKPDDAGKEVVNLSRAVVRGSKKMIFKKSGSESVWGQVSLYQYPFRPRKNIRD